MGLKVVDDPANAVADEEAEKPNKSKGPEATLDSSGSLVDDMHQTMQRGLSGKLLQTPFLCISVGMVQTGG